MPSANANNTYKTSKEQSKIELLSDQLRYNIQKICCSVSKSVIFQLWVIIIDHRNDVPETVVCGGTREVVAVEAMK